MPAIFETPIIYREENTIRLKLIDSLDHIYFIDETFNVYENTPPEIEITIGAEHDILPGYLYSTSPVVLNISGRDNVYTRYVDYYLDGTHIWTDSIYDEFFAFRNLSIDTIGAGQHTAYSIAFDDRGDSTVSNHLDFIIYQAFDIGEEIIDLQKSESKEKIYAITKSSLYIIDPRKEEIVETRALPVKQPTSMDYTPENRRLYMGFSNGQLWYFDEVTEKFVSVLDNVVPVIEDFEVDPEFNIAIMISEEKVLHVDLQTMEVITGPVTVYEGSSVIMDNAQKMVVAGGKPGISRSNLFRLQYDAGMLRYINERRFDAYIGQLIMKPDEDVFSIIETSYQTVIRTHSFDNFRTVGKYTCFLPETGCYSSQGDNSFAGNDQDKYIKKYDPDSFSLLDSTYIPITVYNDVNHMITSADDEKLVYSTTNIFTDEVKLVFIRQ